MKNEDNASGRRFKSCEELSCLGGGECVTDSLRAGIRVPPVPWGRLGGRCERGKYYSERLSSAVGKAVYSHRGSISSMDVGKNWSVKYSLPCLMLFVYMGKLPQVKSTFELHFIMHCSSNVDPL